MHFIALSSQWSMFPSVSISFLFEEYSLVIPLGRYAGDNSFNLLLCESVVISSLPLLKGIFTGYRILSEQFAFSPLKNMSHILDLCDLR